MPDNTQLMQAVIANACMTNGALFLLVWVVATAKQRLHLIDVLWGPSYGITLLVCLTHAPQLTWAQVLLAVGVLTWSVRLGFHLLQKRSQNRRPAVYCDARGTLTHVFPLVVTRRDFRSATLLESSLQRPVYLRTSLSPTPPESTFLFIVGMVIAFIGLGYESIADWQLSEFKASKENQADVLKTGLWRFSRHRTTLGRVYSGGVCG